jgi:hypothetical protein
MARDNNTTQPSTHNNAGQNQASLTSRSHEVADEVRQATVGRMESARESALSAKRNAAERVRKLGATVRKVGEHLRVEDQRYIAEKANDASQKLDNFAGYLNSAELSTVLRDTSAVARRNPALFFGGAFILGIAAGRFLKRDGENRGYQSEPTSGIQPRPKSSSPRTSDASRSGAGR